MVTVCLGRNEEREDNQHGRGLASSVAASPARMGQHGLRQELLASLAAQETVGPTFPLGVWRAQPW